MMKSGKKLVILAAYLLATQIGALDSSICRVKITCNWTEGKPTTAIKTQQEAGITCKAGILGCKPADSKSAENAAKKYCKTLEKSGKTLKNVEVDCCSTTCKT